MYQKNLSLPSSRQSVSTIHLHSSAFPKTRK